MTSPYQRNNVPSSKPKNDGDIALWQFVIGGIFITAGAMLVGVKIAELTFSLWMPGTLR